MSISISSSLSTAALAAANSPSSSPAARTSQQNDNQSAYTVRLTEAQRVYQLYTQGQQVSQIATTLSLSTSTVNHYLGITAGAG